MRKEKFHVVLYAHNREALEKALGSKGIIPSKILSKADLKREKIENEIGRFVSHDEEDYPLIAKALKKALKTRPNAMLEAIDFKRGESITPIERLEFTYTVKSFCELVGIE